MKLTISDKELYADLKESADLLDCCIFKDDNGFFALADLYTGNLVTGWHSLEQWSKINVAKEILSFNE